MSKQQEIVVITGASAGVGRATARAFAKRGAKLALLARGRMGLEQAKLEVERLGGEALIISCDVADAAAVDAAAERVERELGPIDIWVNNAMASVYGPFSELSVEDFHRVTEVTYFGQVHGTKAALARMLPRDRGTIVHVGSALEYRSIPLQSAYCGAKHAVAGFVESLRTELLHLKSKVHVTLVALPGVNTPQFDWTKNLMDRESRPVGRIYQPEVAADAIVFAAHARRKEILVGYPTVEALIGDRLNSGLLDHYMAGMWEKSLSPTPADPSRPNNLYAPVDEHLDAGAHGRFDEDAAPRSLHLWANKNRSWLALAATGLGALLGVAFAGKRFAR